ncbi:MAG: hypothetical protein ACREIU_15375, partial [Planctomycetota bacterium]
PEPGSGGAPRVAPLDLGPGLVRVNPPQMVRTPDGYLHLFVGCARAEGDREPGDVRYLRSVRPEDVSEFVDRSALLPRGTFDRFHNRQAAGLDREGRRLVFINLTDFVPGKHSMNLPLVWFAERDGLDFRFREPVVYGEATSFFYPQVAVTDQGPVVVGAVHREPSRNAELVHLDWDGKVLLWEALPKPEGEVESWAFDLEPLSLDDWSRLVLARHVTPAGGKEAALEFWEYDARARRLARRRSIPDDLAREPNFATAGKVLVVPGKAPLFLNEPGSSACVVWEGDLLGAEALRPCRIPRTRVSDYGYPGIRSLFLPSVLQGSVAPLDGRRPLVVDLPGVARDGGREEGCSWLLWWIRRK